MSFKKPKMIRIMNSLSVDMVKIKKGSFMMGSDEYSDEQPIHKVIIDYDFEIGKYPVTIAEYRHFAKEHPEHLPEWAEEGSDYHIETGNDEHYKKMNLSDNVPIMGVSWENATAYTEWLSDKTGLYYRLPSEAEWEYVCRAGTDTRWSFGDDEEELKYYAWYDDNSHGKTHIVGEKKPNPWGVFDMHGNVWEWCIDDYADNYKKTPIDGSAYKNEQADSKVLRGGSWNSVAINSRSSYRGWGYPGIRSNNVGFRLLRTLP
jgi:formylglycine-generating enzyme required for sulfatase activity